MARIARVRQIFGGILSPFDAHQLTRGMRTLPLRVEAQSRTAMDLAHRLTGHPFVARVYYPGLPNHPGHEVAARQMTGGFGGMMSLGVKGGERAAIATAAAVQVWTRATSLGGVESLIEHRASMEGEGTPCPPNVLRLSVGLEGEFKWSSQHSLCDWIGGTGPELRPVFSSPGSFAACC